ncbi:hypothetical protein [Halorubrum lipolyticum]|uniref:Uncharacterized protein n=1 Tax=Halorubrum lipolyticum DSM 21995 TaxID=1227482 RepID=M0NP43_9EURY|nr:hypothetical protein [Halorubrum lipolyticum]EMA58939.1 hypothetical protein C469_12228 [Halorubrum lipolyticum DSM 21995]
MTNRTDKIEVAVTPAEKNEIRDWVDANPDYTSMAMMLRTLTKREMADGGGEEKTQSASIDSEEVTEAVESALGDVHGRLERIEDSIAELDTGAQVHDDIEDLAHSVVEQLPVLDDPSEFESFHHIYSETENMDAREMAQRASTADDWANYLDLDVSRTRTVLTNMIDWYPDAKYAYADPVDDPRYEIDSETRRYYRVA